MQNQYEPFIDGIREQSGAFGELMQILPADLKQHALEAPHVFLFAVQTLAVSLLNELATASAQKMGALENQMVILEERLQKAEFKLNH